MNKKNNYLLGITFAFINSVCLGIIGVVDKIGRIHTNDPFLFSTQSVAFSFLFSLLIALLFFKQDFFKNSNKQSFTTWKYIFFVGVFASGLFILFRFLGLTQATGTFAALAQVITSPATALLAAIFLAERLSKTFWLLFVIIMVAVYFVSVGKFVLTPLETGDLIIIISALFLACGNIFSQLAIKRTSAINLAVWRFFFGTLFLLTTNIVLFHNSSHLFDIGIWPIISGVIWAIAVIIFNFAIQRIGITFTLSILMTAPVYTMLLESFILKQTFNPLQISAAFVVIITGIMIVLLNKK